MQQNMGAYGGWMTDGSALYFSSSCCSKSMDSCLPHGVSSGRNGSWRLHLMKPVYFLCWDSLRCESCHKRTWYQPNYRHAMLQFTTNYPAWNMNFRNLLHILTPATHAQLMCFAYTVLCPFEPQ